MLIAYRDYKSLDAVLTAALAAPALVAVVVDAVLRRGARVPRRGAAEPASAAAAELPDGPRALPRPV